MVAIVNDPTQFARDAADGFALAYSRYVNRIPDAGVTRRPATPENEVAVVVGGGGGHYPWSAGLVGIGLAAGAAMGDVFTSPSTDAICTVARAAAGAAGVLFCYGNYAGDVLNFTMAQQRLRAEGIECRSVQVTDDIASADHAEMNKRRGIAGSLVVYKIAGAAAARGYTLDQAERLARLANARTRTIGVAFGGCTLPGQTTPLFTVDAGNVAVGLGIHGEPGIHTRSRPTAAELAGVLVASLLAEAPAEAGAELAVVLNGLGSTKYEELFVLWGEVERQLRDEHYRLILPEVGEYVTSLDMSGCSLTLCWLDAELADLWTDPVDSPAFRRGAVRTHPNIADRAPATVSAAPAIRPQAPAAGVRPEALAAAETTLRMLQLMMDSVCAHEQELGRLDSVAGDGDHGRGMVRGLRAAATAAQSAAGGVDVVLAAAGDAWADRGSGTSGALWGVLLNTVAESLHGVTVPTPAQLVNALATAADRVASIGKSAVGDKTMLDALAPFVDELRARVTTGEDLASAWQTAARVAHERALETAQLRPKVGRARPLAERSLGSPDPGAISMALCLIAAGAALSTEPKNDSETETT